MIPVKPTDPPLTGAIARRSTESREADPVDFVALRAAAVALTQDASGKVWTDYNLHDPGVTILEQVCFAMTELAYRADFPVADHLTDDNGLIDLEGQALFAPEKILPCRPTSVSDYRRMLLDRLPELGDARFSEPHAGDPPGLHRLRLRLAHRHNDEERGAARAMRKAARDLMRATRGFGEDLDDVIQSITPNFCELELEAGIEGVRDPIDILADIYIVSAARVGALVQPRTFDELLRQGLELEDIFDGPVWKNGVVERAEIDRGSSGRLSVADLRAAILQIDGVADISRLILHMDGQSDSPVLAWNPARTALRLRMPGAKQHPARPGLARLNRRGVPLSVDYHALARRCADRVRPGAGKATQALNATLPPLPVGVYRPPLPFQSVREHFPIVYGLRTDAAAAFHVSQPERVGKTREAATEAAFVREGTEQLKAYLALFDHILANGAAQLDNVRHLFSVDEKTAKFDRSYWRRLLSERDLPGIEQYYAPDRETLEPDVYSMFDDAAARRGEVLDYLLSLYGETFSQNTTRQFLTHLDSEELAQALLANKLTYLQQAVLLGRDRAAGFDYGKALWSDPDLTTGLHRRISLLVGFADWRARPLVKSLGRWRPQGLPTRGVDPNESIRPLVWPTNEEVERARRRKPTLPPAELHGVLFTNGIFRNRWGWRQDAAGRGGALMLRAGPADDQAGATPSGRVWWQVRRFASEDGAKLFAHELREMLRARTEACEGLHIVEHILLRPRSRRVAASRRFHGLRATLVLPDWTSRTGRRAFRAFVEETMRINCPAHVAADCLWLDLPSMARFERLYARWLRRLREATATRGGEALDAASAALTDFLIDHGVDPDH